MIEELGVDSAWCGSFACRRGAHVVITMCDGATIKVARADLLPVTEGLWLLSNMVSVSLYFKVLRRLSLLLLFHLLSLLDLFFGEELLIQFTFDGGMTRDKGFRLFHGRCWATPISGEGLQQIGSFRAYLVAILAIVIRIECVVAPIVNSALEKGCFLESLQVNCRFSIFLRADGPLLMLNREVTRSNGLNWATSLPANSVWYGAMNFSPGKVDTSQWCPSSCNLLFTAGFWHIDVCSPLVFKIALRLANQWELRRCDDRCSLSNRRVKLGLIEHGCICDFDVILLT